MDWTKVEDLFHAALAEPPDSRSEFLHQACEGDPRLRGEVQALLDRAQSDGFLEGSPLSSVVLPPLSPGQKVGVFEIVELIGRGGMGEVYKAKDTRLGRLVALKRSRDRFSARFEREARAIAALNHPNICTLYDVGPDYLVIEFIEGETLGRRIGGKPLAVGQTIDIAMEIAEALAVAHAKGIIHRDIKPGNIFITESQTGGHMHVKVLDFGLAKLAGQACPGSALGTIGYMSPEQARGENLDARTDLFSFGVVLYEMATGKLPFQGATNALVFEAILHREPEPPARLNPEISIELERIILKLLEKDRNPRYQSASDVLVDLRRLMRDTDSRRSAVASVAPATIRLRRTGLYFAAGLITVGILAAGLAWFRLGKKPPAAAQWQQLTNFPDSVQGPALSPDGRLLAFIRGAGAVPSNQLYIKVLPGGQPTALTTGIALLAYPAFSPDGSLIAYTRSAWDTFVVPVTGGEPRLFLANATGLTWIGPQHLLFSEIKTGTHLALVTATESRTEARDVYVPPRVEGMAHFSALSPDHKRVLLGEMDRNGMLACRLVPFDGSSPGRQVGPVPSNCSGVGWSPDGKWMYVSANAGSGSHIWRQRIDAGSPEQLTFGPSTEEGVAIAPDGKSLITSVGTSNYSVWVHDRRGERQISGEGGGLDPIFSPDGTKVYYEIKPATATGEIWVADVPSGRAERVLPGIETNQKSLSHDGRLLAYSTPDGGLWIAPLDRHSAPRKVTSGVKNWVEFGSSGDLFFMGDDGPASHLYRVKQDGSGRRRALDAPIIRFTSLSADEEWAAVVSTLVPEDPSTTRLRAYPLTGQPVAGGQPVEICRRCWVTWAPDGGSVWLSFIDVTAVVPLKHGAHLPPLPPEGIRDRAQLDAIPGVRVVPGIRAVFAPGLSTWAWMSLSSQRNLYRIPLE